jgi:hypothetical protein
MYMGNTIHGGMDSLADALALIANRYPIWYVCGELTIL